MNILHSRSFYETLLAVLVTLAFGLLVGLLGALATKFQIALAAALVLILLILMVPKRRTLTLILWVLIQPLSIEKIAYTAAPLWEGFRGAEIVINAGDILMVILFALLLVQRLLKQVETFVWGHKEWLFLGLLGWGIVSYLIHRGYYQDPYTASATLGILHLLRSLFFVVVMSSAIQTRSDLIWVLLAMMASIALQSMLVGVSYATGEMYNFSKLLGQYTELQKYSGSDGTLVRATGTLGVSNQQAVYHAMSTFLLIGFFAVKNTYLRYLALLVMLVSFVAVIFTFARTAWLAMAVAVLMLAAIFIRKQALTSRAWLISSIVMMLMAGVLAAAAQPIIDRLTKGDDGSTDSRLRMVSLAQDLFKAHPLIGVGPQGYVEAGLHLYPPGNKEPEWVALGDKPIVPPVGRIELAVSVEPDGNKVIVPLAVHNKYLLVLAELGIVGILLWLGIFYCFYQDAKRCAGAQDVLYRYIGIAGYAALLIALIYMMLDLFNDDKSLQLILFPLLIVSATAKLAAKQHPTR